jgi:hypothetical protein
MLDKDPSGATHQPDVAPKTSGASPGGPFQQGPSPTEPTVDLTLPLRQFTLQYLIAVIKKSSLKD